MADPEVWGTCIGADLYRQYSSICNTPPGAGRDACKQDPACTYIEEYDKEVSLTPCLHRQEVCALCHTHGVGQRSIDNGTMLLACLRVAVL